MNDSDASSFRSPMPTDRWGPDGPPVEAYSRVTNAARFAPLHTFAETTLARLEAEYDVTRSEGWTLEPDAQRVRTARPSVRLDPRSPDAAPLLVSFTTFPGLQVRAGRWHTEPIPACGCDACDESLDDVLGRFEWLVAQVVAGRFREAVWAWRGWKSVEIGDDRHGFGRSRVRIGRAAARALVAGGPARVEWRPWSRRVPAS
jgi:hypothetical protein